MSARPRLFIGSSSEALDIARALQTLLDYDLESTIWTQGVFQPGKFTLEALVDVAKDFDFAVLIAHSDDKLESRGSTSVTPRDNVLFELGMFMGVLGRRRTFILYNRDAPPKLPSDLAGVSMLTYATRADNNILAALGPACYALQQEARTQGCRAMEEATSAPPPSSDETPSSEQFPTSHSVQWNVALQQLAAVADAVVEYQRGVRFSKLVFTYTILDDFSYRAEEVETLAAADQDIVIYHKFHEGTIPCEQLESLQFHVSVVSDEGYQEIIWLPAKNEPRRKEFLIFPLPPLKTDEPARTLRFSSVWPRGAEPLKAPHGRDLFQVLVTPKAVSDVDSVEIFIRFEAPGSYRIERLLERSVPSAEKGGRREYRINSPFHATFENVPAGTLYSFRVDRLS